MIEAWLQVHRRNPPGKCMLIVINKDTKNTTIYVIDKNTGEFTKKNNSVFKN